MANHKINCEYHIYKPCTCGGIGDTLTPEEARVKGLLIEAIRILRKFADKPASSCEPQEWIDARKFIDSVDNP